MPAPPTDCNAPVVVLSALVVVVAAINGACKFAGPAELETTIADPLEETVMLPTYKLLPLRYKSLKGDAGEPRFTREFAGIKSLKKVDVPPI